MAKIELKKPVVEEISANIDGAQSVVLVQYCGLTVEQDTRLRKELRDNGVIYKVYKNTMMNFASREQIVRAWLRSWRVRTQLLSPRQMQLLRHVSLLSSAKRHRLLRSRAVS